MRLLVSIGCNEYHFAENLAGAETDALRIYDALIREEVGEYDPSRSCLLLSPTINDVREALHRVLFSSRESIDTFTFFFAGHGCVSSGSFYMWVKDSTPEAQSISALSLSDLFRSLNEAAPTQSNVIIDACESGGLITDLGVLLKPNLLGDAGTPGVTLVATSAQNQYSGETKAGGLGTNLVLDCIEGREFVQDITSTLDLVEIGRQVSNRLRTSDQTPVVWGLNLYGPPRFCKNPRYAAGPASGLREVIQEWPAGSDDSVRQHFDELWRAYSSVNETWQPREFADVVDAILSPLSSSPEVLAGFAERLGTAVFERAALSDDKFRLVQTASTLAVCLLPHLENKAVRRTTERLLDIAGTALIATSSQLVDDLTTDKYALLAKRGILSELFDLPVRVARVLGWIASGPYLLHEGDPRRQEIEDLFVSILRLALRHYSGSIVAISDAQAPYWALALSQAVELGLTVEAEELAGLLFYSLVNCQGRLARWDISPDKTLDYLLSRDTGDFEQTAELVERPNETLTVLLKAAGLMDLGEVFDDSLWKVDYVSFAAYINQDFAQYSLEMMTGGQNMVWTVGRDVFRTDEFTQTWPNPSPHPESDTEAALVVLASLLYPNRVAWFCFDRITSRA